ncbi:hypothetical protein cypCar_00005427 [Cyprinus carpio]|nr:hypothetical protein cypCar_00005427 [Cyprinus carpio]
MAYIIKDDINHEDWMSCLPEKLWDVPLTHLSIPGEPPRKLSDYKTYFYFTEGFFVAGLNLTTDRCFIASHPRVSLRTLTMENWNQVKKWLEDQKPGAEPTCLNIIAGDFIGPVPFCSLVITLNKKLL